MIVQPFTARTEHLRDGASRFETTARKLKRKMWWKNMKVGRPAAAAAIDRPLHQ